MKRKRSGLKGIVIKVASRCNLNCSYCYMYNLGDESFRLQPKVMSRKVVNTILQRVEEHCLHFDLRTFEFIFHGGEPFLAGQPFFRDFIGQARQQITSAVQLKFGVQTNGTLLSGSWCNLLKELGIGIGISMDGPPAWHDAFRKDHQGRSTHAETLQGLQLAQRHGNRPGVLCVLNVESDPLLLYDYFKALNIKKLDFLWPDYNYESLPPVYQDQKPSPNYTPYGNWWIQLFDRWFSDQTQKPNIRFLSQLVLMIIGIDNGFETIGQGENRYLVIETDGSIEASDYLKACGNGFTKEGLHVGVNRLEEAYNAPLVLLHQQSHRQLPSKCRSCVIREVCGGGHIAHRYSHLRGFDNPSVYCYDLMKLITHVQNTIVRHLPKSLVKQADLMPVTYLHALQSV